MASSLDAYRVFYHVASCESFTKAAGILHNSQPNITRIIRDLEKETGCALFLRSNRGIQLTREGEILYAHVREAMQHIARAEAELQELKHQQVGQITIAASEAALRSVLLPALRSYRRDYPGVQVNVRSMTTHEAIESLHRHLADFSLVTKPLIANPALSVEELATFPDILIAPHDFQGSDSKSLTLEEIASWPFVSMPRRSVSFEMLRDYFARNGLLFQPGTFVSSLSQIVPMVSIGLGAAFLPEFLALDALQSGTVVRVPLSFSPPGHTICMISQANESRSAACLELMKRLRQQTKEREASVLG